MIFQNINDFDQLYDDSHINEIKEEKTDKYHVYYFISNDPLKAITQKLILEEKLEFHEVECLEYLKNLDSILYIEHLFVKPEYREQSIGTELLKKLQQKCLNLNIDCIILISGDSNLKFKTLNFYKKNNFQTILELDGLKNLMLKNILK